MIKLDQLKESDKGRDVIYYPGYGDKEIGRLKSWNDHNIFVVFHCNGEWDRYQEYTGQSTKPEHLTFENEDCEHEWVKSRCINCEELWEPADFSGASEGDR